MVMSTLAVKPGRGLRARPAVPDPHRAGPRCSGFPNSFYAQDQQDECDCRYSGSAVVWPPEETASRGINISYRNVNGGMIPAPGRTGAASAVKVAARPSLVSARAVSKDGAGGAPTARPSGRVHDLVAADAPTAAPETAPARTVIAAASAPRPAVPAKATSACDSCHVGRRHRRPAQRRERLGIMRCRRHHQPHARCRKQEGLPHGLSPSLPIVARRAEKRVPPLHAIDARRIDSICDRPAWASQRAARSIF